MCPRSASPNCRSRVDFASLANENKNRNVSLVIARSESDEAIQCGALELDCFASLAMTQVKGSQ
jgi:hypothetical protein